jgi:DNA repair exonuclease SbcCD ATPase subunit
MTHYPDHTRIAQQLLEQPGEINHLQAELAKGTCDASIADGIAARRREASTDEQVLIGLTASAVMAEVLRLQTEPTREQLLAGEEPYTDEHTAATPAQWIWLWNRATPERRLEVAKEVQAASARAHRCFLSNHEKCLDQHHQEERAELEQARKDVESSDLAARRAMEQRQEMAEERHILQEQRDQLRAEVEYHQQLSAEQGQALARAETAREEQRRRAEQADTVTAETKRLMERRITTLRERTEQVEAELAGALATIDHMSKAMSWVAGHDRPGDRSRGALRCDCC